MARKKPFFDPVDLKINFPEMEKELLDNWYKDGIVKDYLQKNKNSKKYFSFLDGPITANNPMGVHHAWGRTYKDLWQRLNNMRGFRQRFQNGFDCQGLWVEVEVEKELGLKSKKDIENLVPGDKKASIAKFVELCKERVKKYASIQTEQSKRLGYFLDWDNSYYTMSDDNNYMIWYFLKKCHEKGFIYKGRDSVPWCPRCGTAISQHEMLTEDYKEVTHDSVYLEYPVKGKKNTFLLVWTTTPWTVLGNVAIAVDKDTEYALVTGSVGGNEYIILRDLARTLSLKVTQTFKGEELVGLEYDSPFDYLPRVKDSLGKYVHRVVASDTQILPVSEEEGTGLVHIAPGAGTEDFQLGKKIGLPVVELIDEQAKYLDGLEEFSAKDAKNHPELIIDFLKEKENGKYLFDVVPVKHRYPACWRCKTELVWRVVDEWYIAMDKPLQGQRSKVKSQKLSYREAMIKVAKNINWKPKFGLKRELDWLENMHDWLISKKRYWGLALPIWVCEKCSKFSVIGGRDELKERAIEGWGKFEGHSPHRPWIDEVKIRCEECGGMMSRIQDVGNPWLDAGIVPYSTISQDNRGKPLYWQDKKEWRKWFPVHFITESFPGQFKNWFYSMIAMSTVLEEEEPFKTVLGFATLLSEDSRPMHKSWGNMIEFNEGADKIGVDVMRWMYIRQNPSENLLFGYKIADETRRMFHLKLWNIYNFFVTYANLDGWKPATKFQIPNIKSQTILDRWIVSRFNETLTKVDECLDKYSVYKAAEEIEGFVDDFSNWYIRRSRERLGPWIEGKEDKVSFYSTTYSILLDLSKMLAPLVPFISEQIYRNLTKERSVHLSSWPGTRGEIDSNLSKEMADLRALVEAGHSQRKILRLPVRQPLLKIDAKVPFNSPSKESLNLLKDELNVKEIEIKKGPKIEVQLDTRLTPELEEEMRARELIRKIQLERRGKGINIQDLVNVANPWLPKDKVLIERVKAKASVANLEKGDFKITEALK